LRKGKQSKSPGDLSIVEVVSLVISERLEYRKRYITPLRLTMVVFNFCFR